MYKGRFLKGTVEAEGENLEQVRTMSTMDVEDLMKRGKAEKAVDTVEDHFAKASADLQAIERALATELEGTYAKSTNPYNLLNRIKQLEAELPVLTKQCQQLTASRQELIDTAKRSLVHNRSSVRSMGARAGLSVPIDAEDAVYTEFTKILKDWNHGVQASIMLQCSVQPSSYNSSYNVG